MLAMSNADLTRSTAARTDSKSDSGDEALNQGDMRRVLFVELKSLGALLAHPRIPLGRLFQHLPIWQQQHVDSDEAILGACRRRQKEKGQRLERKVERKSLMALLK